MDQERARRLLDDDRSRVEQLLKETETDARADREEANEPGDLSDPAERLTAEEADDAVVAGLRERMDALDRAERRLEGGTYGYSIRSGLAIPDARLEADPAAELTVEEEREA